MNKRMHKKVTCNLVAKLSAKYEVPEFKISITKPEKKILMRETDLVRRLVLDVLSVKGYLSLRSREKTGDFVE